MKTIGFIGLIVLMALAATAAPFTYSVTNNTLNGVDITLYESNAPGNYTFQTEQLAGTNLVLVLTNSMPQATNGIALQFTNRNSFSQIGYLVKLPALVASGAGATATGCKVSSLLTNSFSQFTMPAYASANPNVASGSGGGSTNAPQVNTNGYAANTNVPSVVPPTQYASLALTPMQIGNTNGFYALFNSFSDVIAPSYKEQLYLCASPSPFTNWTITTPQAVYVEPDWFTNSEVTGPSVANGGAVTETGGVLYKVYGNQSGLNPGSPLKGQLYIIASTDMTNWTRIASWTNADAWTNSALMNPTWSQVNYAGSNWIVFQYETNQATWHAYNNGIITALPVNLSGMTATFGAPVNLTTNLNTEFGVGSIVTNNNGLYIMPASIVETPQFPLCSTTFLGPYTTNGAVWTLPGEGQAYTPWLYSVSNNSTWLWWGGGTGPYEISTNWGTNWMTIYTVESTPLASPRLDGMGIQPMPVFRLSTPLTNTSFTVAGDARFTGTVTANNISAQTAHADNFIGNNVIVNGVMAGGLNRPLYVEGAFTAGDVDTNNGWPNGTIVMGEGVLAGPDVGSASGGNVLLGLGYYSDDAGTVFEYQDGVGPQGTVSSPLAGDGADGAYIGTGGGPIVLNSGVGTRVEGSALNSVAGYQANGTAGITASVTVTNFAGAHGTIFNFKFGILTSTNLF
jgi:hypothetical protein